MVFRVRDSSQSFPETPFAVRIPQVPLVFIEGASLHPEHHSLQHLAVAIVEV